MDILLVVPKQEIKKVLKSILIQPFTVKPALEVLGMDIDLHTFRHTSVYLARLGGADLLSISKRLGHKNISITADHYSDLFEETDKEVAQGLEKLQQEVI